MHYPREVIDEIRIGNDIVDVIGDYVKLNKRGSSYVGLCPFHKEKTPSFNVNSENQFYHCFGCGASGNVISFVMEHEGYSFVDAIKFLADRINYDMPEISYSEEYNKKREIKQKLYEVHKVAARFYYDSLVSNNGKAAVAYLDKRKINLKTRRIFGLGYSPIAKGALYNHLKDMGYSDEIIFKSGLAYRKDENTVYDKFFNRLMFPIIDVYGNIIGFGGRILGDGQPKYLNSPESDIFTKSNNLYNLNLAKKSKLKEYILVEGYMDAISIYQAGFKNVVASLGTAFNEKHAKVLKSYANSVILLFDSDEAGTKAILRAIPVLSSAGLKVKVVQVNDAKDPDEYIKKFGPSSFGELLKNAKSHFIFQAEQIQKKYNLELLEDRISFTDEIAKLLSMTDNKIEADAYLKEVSKITQIDLSSIQYEMNKLSNGVDTVHIKRSLRNNIKQDSVDEAKRGLITLLASEKSLYRIYKDNLPSECFDNPIYEKILLNLYDSYENDYEIIPSDIVSRFENIEEQKKVASIFINEIKYTTEQLEKAVNDQLKVVLKSYYTNALTKEKDTDKLKDITNKLKKINNLNISLA